MYRATVTLPFTKMGFSSSSIEGLLLELSQVLSCEDLRLGLRTIVIEPDDSGKLLTAYMALREIRLNEVD